MEGTRHERAALVLTAYAIGFTTAFILYAANINNNSTLISTPRTDANTASVANALKKTPESTNILPIEEVTSSGVTYNNGLLEVTKGDEVSLLSFNTEVAGLDVDTANLTQGFHFGEIKYQVSPDDNFVFFCERQDVTSTTCLGFVYDIEAETIYPVVKNGAPVLISADSLRATKFNNDGLVIGTNYSANAKAPWILIDNTETLDLQ